MVVFRSTDQHYGKPVAAMLQHFSPSDFISGRWGIGKKSIDSIRGRGFLGATGEQRNPILGVTGLPRLQKMIGDGKGWDITGIDIVSRVSLSSQRREQKRDAQ
jgi:hypothetical protein